jgi:hypothetical protein
MGQSSGAVMSYLSSLTPRDQVLYRVACIEAETVGQRWYSETLGSIKAQARAGTPISGRQRSFIGRVEGQVKPRRWD